MKQTIQMRCYHVKKNILNKFIPRTIISNIMCSFVIDNHGGILLLMTKTDHTELIDLISPNGLTPSVANERLRLQGYY